MPPALSSWGCSASPAACCACAASPVGCGGWVVSLVACCAWVVSPVACCARACARVGTAITKRNAIVIGRNFVVFMISCVCPRDDRQPRTAMNTGNAGTRARRTRATELSTRSRPSRVSVIVPLSIRRKFLLAQLVEGRPEVLENVDAELRLEILGPQGSHLELQDHLAGQALVRAGREGTLQGQAVCLDRLEIVVPAAGVSGSGRRSCARMMLPRWPACRCRARARRDRRSSDRERPRGSSYRRSKAHSLPPRAARGRSRSRPSWCPSRPKERPASRPGAVSRRPC